HPLLLSPLSHALFYVPPSCTSLISFIIRPPPQSTLFPYTTLFRSLKGARIEEDRLVVGALTTHYDVSKDELILDKIPALAKAASVIGDLQIRNRGTIGGNLAHGDPVADYPAVAIALDASLKVVSEDGEEDIPLEGFV